MLKNKTILFTLFWVMLLVLASASFAAPEIVYDAGKRRDPFAPLTGGEDSALMTATSSSVKLEGIIYDPGKQSMAILNGKTYQAGEAVGDAKLVKILRDHVVILIDGEEKTLRIREEEKA